MAFRIDVTTASNTQITFSLSGTWAKEEEARAVAQSLNGHGAWNGDDFYNPHRIFQIDVVEV